MFSLLRPSPSAIRRKLEIAKSLPGSHGIAFDTQCGPEELCVPKGYARDHTRTEIGNGEQAFETACAAFRRWEQFNLGWVRVANPATAIEPEEIVAGEAHTRGVWS